MELSEINIDLDRSQTHKYTNMYNIKNCTFSLVGFQRCKVFPSVLCKQVYLSFCHKVCSIIWMSQIVIMQDSNLISLFGLKIEIQKIRVQVTHPTHTLDQSSLLLVVDLMSFRSPFVLEVTILFRLLCHPMVER